MELIQFFLIFLIFFIFSFQIEFDWNEKQILIANDGKEDDEFGSSIDMITNICVIGSFGEDNFKNQGKAYIFENNGTNWNERQILIANDSEPGNYFGSTVSISNDGNLILIGSPLLKVGENLNQGKVYVFGANATNWNQLQTLIANDGQTDDNFGKSVSIANGYFFIGSPYAKVGENYNRGKVYIFKSNGTFWNEKQILIANDSESENYFGLSLSVSNDGNLILIGAPIAKVGENLNQGKVYVFENNGTFWNQKQVFTASDGNIGDLFGSTISMYENYCAVSSPHANISGNVGQGKVYIFENNGINWNQKQILIASDGKENDHFGSIISISSNDVLIGSPQATVGDEIFQGGKVYSFQKSADFWNEKQILIEKNPKTGNNFGKSIALSGNYSFISTPFATVVNFYQGQVYFLEFYPKKDIDVSSNSKPMIIAFSVVFLIFFVGTFLVVVCIRRRKRKKNKDQKNDQIQEFRHIRYQKRKDLELEEVEQKKREQKIEQEQEKEQEQGLMVISSFSDDN